MTPETDPCMLPDHDEADDGARDMDRVSMVERLVAVAKQVGMGFDFDDLSEFVSGASVRMQQSGNPLRVHDSNCSWDQHYAVLSFLMNGHLYSEYERLSGWLGLPPTSNTQWHRIVQKLEPAVTELAEWSGQRGGQGTIGRAHQVGQRVICSMALWGASEVMALSSRK